MSPQQLDSFKKSILNEDFLGNWVTQNMPKLTVLDTLTIIGT